MNKRLKKHEYYGFTSWGKWVDLDHKYKDGDGDWGSIANQFQTDIGPKPEYVWAVYSTPAWEGSAVIIFYRNGEWFYASGSHCSCYGLEEQWSPEIFNPVVYFQAEAKGRRLALVANHEGEFPDATEERFDRWLKLAMKKLKK